MVALHVGETAPLPALLLLGWLFWLLFWLIFFATVFFFSLDCLLTKLQAGEAGSPPGSNTQRCAWRCARGCKSSRQLQATRVQARFSHDDGIDVSDRTPPVIGPPPRSYPGDTGHDYRISPGSTVKRRRCRGANLEPSTLRPPRARGPPSALIEDTYRRLCAPPGSSPHGATSAGWRRRADSQACQGT